MSAFFESFLIFIGLYTLMFYLYDVLKAPFILIFYRLIACIGCSELNIKEKYGDWAAITGSTDGIGKEYARELAARGINVILISRSLEKLMTVAKEIECEFHVQTKVIAVDFSKDKEACRFVEEQLELTPVRILVNNVGQTTPDPGPLAAFTDEELWNVIFTNIGAVTQLSRYFIKRLHKQSQNQNQSGIIVNVGSGTAHFPTPNNAIYGATKAYIRSLTLALQEETRTYNIDVQLLSPHFVSTKFINYSNVIKYSHFVLPNVKPFVRSAVNRLGKVAETTGYFQHDIEYALLKLFPSRLTNLIVIIFLKAISSKIKSRSL